MIKKIVLYTFFTLFTVLPCKSMLKHSSVCFPSDRKTIIKRLTNKKAPSDIKSTIERSVFDYLKNIKNTNPTKTTREKLFDVVKANIEAELSEEFKK